MSAEPGKLVLVYLCRIDGKIDRLTEDVQDLKHREPRWRARSPGCGPKRRAFAGTWRRCLKGSTASKRGSTGSSVAAAAPGF